MAEGKAKANRPHQNADIVGVHQRANRVRYHAHQQAVQHFKDAGRRHDLAAGRAQRQVLRQQMAGDHRDNGSAEGAEQIEDNNWADIGLLPLLVVRNRRDHQHQHQQGGHGFQRADKQLAEQANRQRMTF